MCRQIIINKEDSKESIIMKSPGFLSTPSIYIIQNDRDSILEDEYTYKATVNGV
jgi:hypothetical protein